MCEKYVLMYRNAGGPQWTSVQNLTSIILSIQTILNIPPIHNEPGYENIK